jgi:hypothetical protein
MMLVVSTTLVYESIRRFFLSSFLQVGRMVGEVTHFLADAERPVGLEFILLIVQ